MLVKTYRHGQQLGIAPRGVALQHQAAEHAQRGQEGVGVIWRRGQDAVVPAPCHMAALLPLGSGGSQGSGRLAGRGGGAVRAVEGEEVAFELDACVVCVDDTD